MPSFARTCRIQGRQADHHKSARDRREALPARQAGRILGAVLFCLASAGCSTLPAGDEALITGSVTARPIPVSASMPEGAAPKGIAEADWAQAKAALDLALKSHDKDPSIPWENTATGASGTATPIGPERAGCRDFMISVVDGKDADRWIQGQACRARSGTALSQVRILGRA